MHVSLKFRLSHLATNGMGTDADATVARASDQVDNAHSVRLRIHAVSARVRAMAAELHPRTYRYGRTRILARVA